MDKKIKYRITNIDELAKKLKKAQALSEELASVLKEIDEFKAKIRFEEWRILPTPCSAFLPKWTQKVRVGLYRLLKKHDVVPIIEKLDITTVTIGGQQWRIMIKKRPIQLRIGRI